MIHPMTPPPELVQQWRAEAVSNPKETFSQSLATRAAQWGADCELEACCEWLQVRINEGWNPCHLEDLRTARRPKPPSLKEQALETLETLIHGDSTGLDVGVIRRALEALPE